MGDVNFSKKILTTPVIALCINIKYFLTVSGKIGLSEIVDGSSLTCRTIISYKGKKRK